MSAGQCVGVLNHSSVQLTLILHWMKKKIQKILSNHKATASSWADVIEREA